MTEEHKQLIFTEDPSFRLSFLFFCLFVFCFFVFSLCGPHLKPDNYKTGSVDATNIGSSSSQAGRCWNHKPKRNVDGWREQCLLNDDQITWNSASGNIQVSTADPAYFGDLCSRDQGCSESTRRKETGGSCRLPPFPTDIFASDPNKWLSLLLFIESPPVY